MAVVSVGLLRRHPARAQIALWIGIAALAGFWWMNRIGPLDAPALDASPRLMRLEGVIEQNPIPRTGSSTVLSRYQHLPMTTAFVLRTTADQRVWVTLPLYDGTLRAGDAVRCTGWLEGFHATTHPADDDTARRFADRGIRAHLRLKTRANLESLKQPANPWTRWRSSVTRTARHALRRDLDIQPEEPALALLETLLTGSGRERLGSLGDAFRITGLAHLLAISGLHVGLVAGGAWWLIMLITGRPRAAAIGCMIVVLVYILIVGPRIPILRAGALTMALSASALMGRSIRPLPAIALIAWLLLIWHPGDLFDVGYQLSFGIAAALVLFVNPLRLRLLPEPVLRDQPPSRWRRTIVDSFAVSLVAWSVAAPIIAFRFHVIHPLGIPLTMLTLPMVAIVLWLGFVKMLLSMLWPPAGACLGDALVSTARVLCLWADAWAHTRVSEFQMPPPSIAWIFGTLATVCAWFHGAFRQRLRSGLAALLICMIWPWSPALIATLGPPGVTAEWAMFAVDDGSCHLLRSGNTAWLFDAGSSGRSNLARRDLIPALHHLGVIRVDTLVISHPDLDHFSAVPELIDALHIRRVLITQNFKDRIDGAPAALRDTLRDRRIKVEILERGWTESLGAIHLQALWPPRHFTPASDNDGSIVLNARVGVRRLLLCGDIQNHAMRELMRLEPNLHADAMELPHHGSWCDAAPAWLRHVDPALVFQSTGARRLKRDRWAAWMTHRTRGISAIHGLCRLQVLTDGSLRLWRHRHDDKSWKPVLPRGYNENIH